MGVLSPARRVPLSRRPLQGSVPVGLFQVASQRPFNAMGSVAICFAKPEQAPARQPAAQPLQICPGLAALPIMKRLIRRFGPVRCNTLPAFTETVFKEVCAPIGSVLKVR